MPTTSNFGWTTPADTDLVKDGAAAIRTLGNGIDTSLIDLKGGATGQVLSKASNTDLDYSWVTPNVGDITEVQAGTGISVASGTGPIPVVTNTVATAYDAKGDLIVGTGADTFSKLSVGTNDFVLTAASGEATGLKWAAVPAGGSMTLLSTTSMSGATTTVSSISGSYKDLVIQVKNWYANANAEPSIYFNGFNSTNAYRGVQWGVKLSTVIGITALSATSGFNVATGFTNIENSPANNMLVIYINDYAGTTVKKSLRWQIVANNGAGEMCNAMGFGTSVDVAASAITSFSMSTPSGTFSAGSILVYGVN